MRHTFTFANAEQAHHAYEVLLEERLSPELVRPHDKRNGTWAIKVRSYTYSRDELASWF